MEIFDLGSPWSWAIGGVILMALEMAAPGFFLIWLGLAALIVGAGNFIKPLSLGGEWAFVRGARSGARLRRQALDAAPGRR